MLTLAANTFNEMVRVHSVRKSIILYHNIYSDTNTQTITAVRRAVSLFHVYFRLQTLEIYYIVLARYAEVTKLLLRRTNANAAQRH